MSKKKTYEEIKNIIENDFKQWMKLTLVSTSYNNNKEPLIIKDDNNYYYNLSYDKLYKSFKNNAIIKKFYTNNKFTLNNIKNYLILNNSDLKLLSTEYLGNNHKLLFQCKYSHKFERSLSDLQNDYGLNCIHCNGKTYRNTDTYINEVFSLVANEYSILGNFKNVDTNILTKHNTCGYEWNITPYLFINLGIRCPKCSVAKKRTKEEANLVLKNLTNGEYEIIGEYKGVNYKTEVIHHNCGYIWNPTFNNLTHKTNPTRCPICKPKSKGENLIQRYLILKNVEFIKECRFDDCRNKKPLPFDFYLPKHNMIIEFDGRQHYSVSQFGGISIEVAKKEFNNTQINDNIKNNYCERNNIKLVRIPYWELNKISHILDEIIN